MTTSTARKQEVAHDPGSRKPDPAALVWEQLNDWMWTSAGGRYRLERFVTGQHEAFGGGFHWPERYRILKCVPEWCHEFAPPEEDIDIAKRRCQEDAVST